MDWTTLFVGSLLLAVVGAATAVGLVLMIYRAYGHVVVRIFSEKPLFLISRDGENWPDADDVQFPTTHGLRLMGTYLRTQARRRRGVILFAPEYGASRWSCLRYCSHLLEAGYDIFTFDFRNFGDSDMMPGYDPLQWITDYEVQDVQAAVECLRQRFDAPPEGIAFFGISRGAGAGLIAAARDPWIRCCITDGAFSTMSTMVLYMKKWVRIYSDRVIVLHFLPDAVFWGLAWLTLGRVQRERACVFPSLKRAVSRLSTRPMLMIHGGADSYIKPELARDIFDVAREPKELWIVPEAKHNQAVVCEPEEYQRRTRAFLASYLPIERVPQSELKVSLPALPEPDATLAVR